MGKDKLTLLVFENDWCAQCYTERPVVNNMAAEFASQLAVKIVNVKNEPLLVKKYNVHTAPTIILIKDGIVVEQIPRFINQQQLEAVIRYYL